MAEPKRIKVCKRDGKWLVDPQGLKGCQMVLEWDTYEGVILDLNMILAIGRKTKTEGVE